MEFDIKNLPYKASRLRVTEEISKVLHAHPGHFVTDPKRLPNFEVKLNYQQDVPTRNDGTGTLMVTNDIGRKFYGLYCRGKIRVEIDGRRLTFYPNGQLVEKGLALKLQRARFMDPKIEQKHQQILDTLEDLFLVSKVQIGTYCYPANARPGHPRSFSMEWEGRGMAWLGFEYDHKLIRIEMENSPCHSISVSFDKIRKLDIGLNWGKPCVCFDLLTPPMFYGKEINGTRRKYRHRLSGLDDDHVDLAPYAWQLRLIFFCDIDSCQLLDRFEHFCRVAGIQSFITHINVDDEERERKFFEKGEVDKVTTWLTHLTDWRVAFQIESLLRSGTTNTVEVLDLKPRINELIRRYGSLAGEIMRYFVEAATNRHPAQPLKECLKSILQRSFRFRQQTAPPGQFFCHHVTFTPTRLLLEGPNITQSNRVVRNFKDYADFFIRVDFRDEDRLQYKWTRDIDSSHLLQTRVGQKLKQGFKLAGRHFDFLAYSQSALRSHAVWFVSPFYHEEREQWVTAQTIRDSLGDFRKDIYCPSRYGARMALAFTATNSSVRIHEAQWRQIRDIQDNGVVFTDGVGTISEALSNLIWQALCQNRGEQAVNVVQPSAYQIRFLGYKGVVCIDKRLKGIHMCLRNSMKKFDVPGKEYADIEIVDDFNRPKTANLNRPLVMILEDRGARRQAFLDLQNDVVSKTRRAGESMETLAGLLERNNLCSEFRLSDVLRRLGQLGLGLDPNETPFFSQLRSCAINHILRYVKYRARIPIPESCKLVGVADIGPDYVRRGFENVYCLEEGRIFACIQNTSDEEPVWIQGSCVVSRSPVIHPGDVQRVYAIGKPPADKLCLFSHLRNVVVFASQGKKSLPNSLAGGDLDGDLYEVIQHEPFLVPEYCDPSEYEPAKPFKLPRPSTIDNVCDFIVEYIYSDVVGLVADKHIVIADQSVNGTRDKDCLRLAKLHSQAVDYPKNGNRVDIRSLPRQLIPFKPDWHATKYPNHCNPDYYESPRALGHLYRNIELEENQITRLLLKNIETTLYQKRFDHSSKSNFPDTCRIDRVQMNLVFIGYQQELKYISTAYSLSMTPLREEELVAGIILDSFSSEGYKKDRMYAMKESLRFLLRDTTEGLLGVGGLETASDEEVKERLARGWDVWAYNLENAFQASSCERFGSHSFGLIALRHVLDCLVRLNSLPPP